MPIKFNRENNSFSITTNSTLYTFMVAKDKYLVHTYYGRKRGAAIPEFSPYVVSFAPYREDPGYYYSPDILPLEFPTFGCGDFRCSSLRIHNADGNSATEFFYKSYKIFHGRKPIPGMPFGKPTAKTDTLEIILADTVTGCEVSLYYTVFAECDVISRSFALRNDSGKEVTIEKCMSLCLDLPGCDYDWVSLYGGHYDERHLQRSHIAHGSQAVFSRRGASSPQFNPFIALCSPKANENAGDVYGFNFVWSGSFLDEIEVDQCDNTRIQIGLGSDEFKYTLDPGCEFRSPEAVMTYSNRGFGKMTRNFHSFVNSHIIPDTAKARRPIVLNTWEACYFSIDEEKLLKFADESKKCGIDMLVVDDGWFGARNNDTAGLGDWYTNTSKFKNGLGVFADAIAEKGLELGIWVEPEMVNPNSDLYRAHPEWCLRCPGRECSLSRNQLVLDMSNPEVIEYLEDAFTKVFTGVRISYFKWDMNRHISEAASAALPAERQGEVWFRYMLGTYKLLRWFADTFPDAMIETCSGGGGRYDLGMMALGSQIWASDNTNPYSRMWMQHSALLAYPASVMSCHVSNPGSDLASLDFRYKVACGGILGYELNILRAPEEVKSAITRQVGEYRLFDDIIRTGEYYSLLSPFACDCESHYYITGDRSRILLTFAQKEEAKAGRTYKLKIKQADRNAVYTDILSGTKYDGAALYAGLDVTVEAGKDHALMFCFASENK